MALEGLSDKDLKRIVEIKNSTNEIQDAARNLNREFAQFGQLTVNVSSEFSAINSSVNNFAKIQAQAAKSSKATSDAIKEQNKQLSTIKLLNIQIDDLYTRSLRTTGAESKILLKQAEALASARDNAKELATAYESLAESSATIDKNTLVFSSLSEVVKDIPGLRKLSGPFEAAAQAARETVINNAKNQAFLEEALKTGKGLTAEKIKELGLEKEAGGLTGTAAAARLKAAGTTAKTESASLAGLKSGFKALGPIVKSALGPLALIQLAVEAIGFFKDAMFEANKESVAIGKNLQLSQKSGDKIRDSYKESKNTLETQYKLTSAMVQAEEELSELSSLSNLSSEDQLDVQIQLTKEVGLQASNAANLNKFFVNSGKSSKENLDTAYETVAQFANQNHMLFNSRKVLEQASKVSGQMLVSFKGSTKELINAVLQANKLGISLEQAKGISESMLDFESSISKELEAELLTGKDLNLENARALALKGNFVGAAKEALKNVGGIAEFERMNVIQQKALAEAVGLTVDQLSDALIQQKYQGTETGEQIKRFKKLGMVEEANALATGKLTGEALKLATQQLNAEEQFNIQVQRAKEIFTDLVSGGTIQTIADALKNLADSALLAPYKQKEEAKKNEEKLTKQKEEDEKAKRKSKVTDADIQAAKKGQETVGIGDRLKAAGVGAGIGAAAGAGFLGLGAIPGAIGGAIIGLITADVNSKVSEANAKIAQKKVEQIQPKETKKADGGIVTSTVRNITAGEAGPEAIVPLNEFYNKLDMLIAAVEKGSNIYLEADKVGTSENKHTFKLNR